MTAGIQAVAMASFSTVVDNTALEGTTPAERVHNLTGKIT